MDDMQDLKIQTKVVENALNELIQRWALASYDEKTVINGLLSLSINLTFRMSCSDQDAVDMIAEHVTEAMIEHHEVRDQ